MLFVDTFNRWFEPENARAAERVLARAGYRGHARATPAGERPLCCGRTFLAVGLVEEARQRRGGSFAALAPFLARGVPVIGLEPSCLLTLRDELAAMLPGAGERSACEARQALRGVHRRGERGRALRRCRSKPMPGKAVLHTHCHQKAFAIAGSSVAALKLVPDLEVESFDSTCCGMAGAFGYEAEHYDMSLRIGELGVLPKLRAAPDDALLVACRHQLPPPDQGRFGPRSAPPRLRPRPGERLVQAGANAARADPGRARRVLHHAPQAAHRQWLE